VIGGRTGSTTSKGLVERFYPPTSRILQDNPQNLNRITFPADRSRSGRAEVRTYADIRSSCSSMAGGDCTTTSRFADTDWTPIR
jgi:hypothetical protein